MALPLAPWCELLEILRCELEQGIIVECSEDEQAAVIDQKVANYPRHFPSEGASLSGTIHSAEDAGCFLDRLIREAELEPSQIVTVMWDQVGYGGLSMSLSAVREHLAELWSMPPHMVVLAAEARWCISISMEGYGGFTFRDR